MPRGGARAGAGRKPKGKQPDRLAKAIERAKDLAERMLDELGAVTSHVGELEDLIEIDTLADKDGGKRRASMLRAIELPSRVSSLKQLLAATRAWAELEERLQQAKKPAGEGVAAPAASGFSKKAERAAAAQGASIGKFASPPPPGKLQ
jgi:hypothetical protein